ncbi:MAG: GlxA family transcriptional regulator [Ignavibacteria bacterium]
MKHVSILIPKGHFSLVNVEGSYQILAWVNECLQRLGRKPMFELHLVGVSKSITQTVGLYTINPDMLINEVEKTDLVILPAVYGDVQKNLEMNAELVPWIIEQYKEGAELVSLCIGSFFLASTGLLNGKQCSTHWMFANEFRRLFPDAKLMDDKIITEDDGIYTSGGAYSFTNLLIYLVEKYAGREVAILAAKAFMIDIERNSQSPFIVFAGQKAHNDESVLNAQEYIEQNYKDKITVDRLSDKFGVGRRTFERRFKKATANTVVGYIQRVKIEAAKKELESSRKNINEVMYDVGYSDTKAFRTVFKKITGISPIEYRNKYNKETV